MTTTPSEFRLYFDEPRNRIHRTIAVQRIAEGHDPAVMKVQEKTIVGLGLMDKQGNLPEEIRNVGSFDWFPTVEAANAEAKARFEKLLAEGWRQLA